MCKFCEITTKKVLVEKVSKRGRSHYDYEDKTVNPTWDNAGWENHNFYTNQIEKESSMEVTMNLDTNKVEFNYKAYSCDSSFHNELKIKFCPFCGRKLNL